MKISDVRELLKDKRVIDEINKHLWIESQKVGYSIGIERATDEWLRLYAEGWVKYHISGKYKMLKGKKKSAKVKEKTTSVKKETVPEVKTKRKVK